MSCVEVCPVDCFYHIADPAINEKYGKSASPTGKVGIMAIHMDECIHCGACEVECPVSAIFEDTSVPAEENELVEEIDKKINAMSSEELDKIRCTQKS